MDTTVTFKIKKRLRDDAKRTAKHLGIPLTTVINAHLVKFVREGRFEVSLTPRPERAREWKRLRDELKKDPKLVRSFTDVEDFIKALGLE